MANFLPGSPSQEAEGKQCWPRGGSWGILGHDPPVTSVGRKGWLVPASVKYGHSERGSGEGPWQQPHLDPYLTEVVKEGALGGHMLGCWI